jgi:hypothetical protein
MVAGCSWGNKVYLLSRETGILWNYDTGSHVSEVSISASGKYIVVSSDKIYLFNKDSEVPLWNRTLGHGPSSVAISADGKYIVAGTGSLIDENLDGVFERKTENFHLLDRESGDVIWNYTSHGYGVSSVYISANGEHITAVTWVEPLSETELLIFKNFFANHTSIILYNPHNGTALALPVTLQWFACSNESSNLTFDVFLDTDSNPITKVASNLTDFNYTPSLMKNRTYYWKVVAKDGSNHTFSRILSFVTLPNVSPIAEIDSIHPLIAEVGVEIVFNGSGVDSDGSIATYQWDSSIDGILGTEEDLILSNLSVGNHTISFRTQDDEGLWSEWVFVMLTLNPIVIDNADNQDAEEEPENEIIGNNETDESGTNETDESMDEEGGLSSVPLLAVVTMLGIISIMRRR